MIEQIIRTKRQEVAALAGVRFPPRNKPILPLNLREGVNIIAELKRRSPSVGFINEVDDRRIDAYNRHACAVSVLTDQTYFGGSYAFLEKICQQITLPVLCKDFIIDRVQVDQAFSAGADIILLIARILTLDRFVELYAHAGALGLQCLVEIHSDKELEQIHPLNASIVGVNARDLDTLAINLDRAAILLKKVRASIRIAESGIRSRDDIARLSMADAFLIGEALMRPPDVERAFRELIYG